MDENPFGGRILIVAPHCDDEVLGCGGTILKFRHNVVRLAVAYVVPGSADRQTEAAAVQRELAVDAAYCLSGVDGFCDSVSLDCVRTLTALVQSERPDVVLAPHSAEQHPDHRSAWRIAVDAVHKARFWPPIGSGAIHRIRSLMTYEIWTPMVQPSIVYDVSAVFEHKLRLMAHYATQTREFPYVEYVTAFNSWRGFLFQKGGQVEAFGLHAI